MPLGTDSIPSAGSPAAARGLIIRDFRPGDPAAKIYARAYQLISRGLHEASPSRGKTVPLGDQEPIGRNAKSGMMMKPAPTPAFIVT